MNTALTILVAMSAASVLSLVLGLIGARYTRTEKITYVEGIPFGETVHRGAYIADAAGFLAVLAALTPTALSLFQILLPAIVTGTIGFFGTKALLGLLGRGR